MPRQRQAGWSRGRLTSRASASEPSRVQVKSSIPWLAQLLPGLTVAELIALALP